MRVAPITSRLARTVAETEHTPGCPGDPAEWGDMAYTTKETK